MKGRGGTPFPQPLLPAVLLAAGLLLGACSRGHAPERPQFGAKEIAERLCERGPRDSGTPGAAAAAEWIADELRFAGCRPEVDAFDDPAEDGSPRVFRNVVATLPGKWSGPGGAPRRFLLLSHYDTKPGVAPGFVGANDGASSTALLLALAKWYRMNPCEATLTFAFLDGEEAREDYGPRDGLRGSRRLAAKMKGAGTRLDGVILLDMVGDRDLFLTIPRNASRRLVAALRQSARALGLGDRVAEASFEMLDDHVPFLEVGYPAIDIIDFEYGSAPGLNDYWHTAEDTPDKLSDETLDAVGALVIDLVKRL